MTELPCSIVGAEKLPGEVGGAEFICREIRAAAGEVGGQASVVVTVGSPYVAAAKVTRADGSTLPEIGVSSADRTLNAAALRRFAENIGQKIRSPH